MEFSVARSVDAYIDSVTEIREPDSKYHPSSMFGCLRQAIYQVRGTPITEELDMLSKRRFYIGHRLHEAVQRALESDPEIVEYFHEFGVDTPEGVVGHGDSLILLKDGSWWIVEVKSIKKWGMRMGLPKEHHVSQAKAYAWAVKKYGFDLSVDLPMPHDPVDVAGIIMVYLEKDELTIVEKFIPWDDSWNGEVAERIVELDMYRDDPESLPPRLRLTKEGKRPWPCNYCPYMTKCYKVDTTEIAPTGGY